MNSAQLPGQLDVDEVLEVVAGDELTPPRAAVRGELVSPADELAAAFAATLVARPHHAHLVAGGRSSATVKKDRAALNSFLRRLAEHGRVPAEQAREVLAVRLPRAERSEREPPKALSAAQYERLVREAKARIPDDPLAGARDLAIVLVLGDAGLRCEELARPERRDFLPARRARSCARSTSATARATAAGASSSRPPRRGRSAAGTASARARSANRPTTSRCSSRSAAAATAATRASAAAAASRCSPTC